MAKPLLEMLGSRTETLISPLDPKACADRLREVVDNELMIFGSKPLRGVVFEAGARVRKRIGYRNSFQSVMHVSLAGAPGGGSKVTCKSGPSIFVVIFLAVWFGALLLFLAGALGTIFQQGPSLFLAAPVGMMVFGVALTLFGRFLARNEHDDMLAIIRRRTEAQPVIAAAGYGRPIVE